MDPLMLSAFADELAKVAALNIAVPQPASPAKPPPSPGIDMGKNPAAKPTNYSVVHSVSPPAAFGASSESKAAPPPPVNT
jgi:hypothetical protein